VLRFLLGENMEIIKAYLENVNKNSSFLSYDLKDLEKNFLQQKKEIKEKYKNQFLETLKKEINEYFERYNPENNKKTQEESMEFDEENLDRQTYSFYKSISAISYAPIGVEYYDDDYEFIDSTLSLYEKSETTPMYSEFENSKQILLDEDNYDRFNSIVDFLNSRVREDVLYILFESKLEIIL
jgi:hypothetical protein